MLHVGWPLPMAMYSWDMSEWSIVSGELVGGWGGEGQVRGWSTECYGRGLRRTGCELRGQFRCRERIECAL